MTGDPAPKWINENTCGKFRMLKPKAFEKPNEEKLRYAQELKCVVCGELTNEEHCGLVGIQINGLGDKDSDGTLRTVCSVKCAATYLRNLANDLALV